MKGPGRPPSAAVRDRGVTGRGFTLLEILVALAVLSVVLLAVYRLYAHSISATRSARFDAVAPLLARQKIAQLELGGRDALQDGAGDFGDAWPGCTWRLTVTDAAATRLGETAGRLKRIDLTVIKDADGLQYRVRAYRFLDR